MRSSRTLALQFCGALAWLLLSVTRAQAQQPAPPPLRLEALEQLALKNNPTLAQAEAAIRAAEGRRKQAGLWPNPIAGYAGEGLAFDPRVRAYQSNQGFFVEQTILTGSKLAKDKAIAAQDKAQAEVSAEAQRLRVVSAVRVLYYETLGAQQLVDLRKQLADLTREAMTISEDLYNIGQADRPDVLAAEVELQRAEIEQLRAENGLTRLWQALAAVVNEPSLQAQFQPLRLDGSLEVEAPPFKFDELLATLLRDSPEIKAAQTGVARAQAVLARAKVEPVPDVFLRAGASANNEYNEIAGRRTGWEARVEAGIRLPLFNRNQGNSAAAQADLLNAEREVQRVELELRTRLAESYAAYLNALGMAARYQREILPRAQRAYDLYLAKFRQMAAAYPQVLISQRTLFEARTESIAAQVELWQSVAQLRGLLLMGGLNAPNTSLGANR
ncbi:MAG: TolC family protein [Acidobacteria bacterium]|nr:TolC family protein [Acidobacteriota bacterium]MBI3427140.1 TolC family protein [Acidobacteriota bacterium]